MKPLRVLHIIESLGRGGAERQLINVVTSLDRTRFEPIVVCLNNPTDFTIELDAHNIHWLCLNLPRFAHVPLVTGHLVNIIRGVRADIVHTWLFRADVAGRIAARLCGIPVISSVQAPVYEDHIFINNPQQKRWKIEIIRVLDWLTGRISNAHYVGCSHDTSQSIGRALNINHEHLQTIYNSIHLPSINSHLCYQARLITIGRLEAQKGHRYSIKAMASVIKTIPDCYLSIVGLGNQHDYLKKLAYDHNLSKNIVFLGNQQAVYELLSDHTIFVFPSLWEGFGIALIEAMAVGLPVIASDIGVFHEIIDDGVQGILIPPQNPEALAQAIIQLLNDPERCKRMGQAGRQRVAERFDIRVTVKQWEHLYQQLEGT